MLSEYKEYKVEAPVVEFEEIRSLVNFQDDEHTLLEFKRIFEATQVPMYDENIERMICPLTGQIMVDPVIVNHVDYRGRIYEREAILRLKLTDYLMFDDHDKKKQIDDFLHQYPHLMNNRYLPHAWIQEMSMACVQGNIGMIRALVKRDKRLLFAAHPVSQYHPLHYAVLNENSLDVFIELLEKEKPGLAIYCLLQSAPTLNKSPLEYVLHQGAGLAVMIKLMSWIREVLPTIFLSQPLSDEKKPFLNSILLISILRNDAVLASQALIWGAELSAPLLTLENNASIILAQANPEISDVIEENLYVNKRSREGEVILKNEDKWTHVWLTAKTIQGVMRILIAQRKLDLDFLSLTSMDYSMLDQDSRHEKIIFSDLANVAEQFKQEVKIPQSIAIHGLFTPPSNLNSKKNFFQLVVAGEQDKVEEMLKLNAKLLLIQNEVMDLSQRQFKNITGFQYALWSLDYSMWTMMLKYFSQHDALQQLEQLQKNGTEHGFHFNPDQYIEVMNKYIRTCSGLTTEARKKLWCEVGAAQRLFPVGFVNEFCNSEYGFNPGRTFRESNMQRTRRIRLDAVLDDWFTCTYKNAKLGDSFGIYRAGGAEAVACEVVDKVILAHDRNSINKLFNVRMEQRHELLLQLQGIRLSKLMSSRSL